MLHKPAFSLKLIQNEGIAYHVGFRFKVHFRSILLIFKVRGLRFPRHFATFLWNKTCRKLIFHIRFGFWNTGWNWKRKISSIDHTISNSRLRYRVHITLSDITVHFLRFTSLNLSIIIKSKAFFWTNFGRDSTLQVI